MSTLKADLEAFAVRYRAAKRDNESLPTFDRRDELAGADLRGADLTEVNLRRADLGRANLTEANLRLATLRRANLYGANLREADLRGANLYGANLREADLSRANLRGADLRGTNLTGADLRGADLRMANLEGTDLRGADLEGAILREADLEGQKAVSGIMRRGLGEGHISPDPAPADSAIPETDPARPFTGEILPNQPGPITTDDDAPIWGTSEASRRKTQAVLDGIVAHEALNNLPPNVRTWSRDDDGPRPSWAKHAPAEAFAVRRTTTTQRYMESDVYGLAAARREAAIAKGAAPIALRELEDPNIGSEGHTASTILTEWRRVGETRWHECENASMYDFLSVTITVDGKEIEAPGGVVGSDYVDGTITGYPLSPTPQDVIQRTTEAPIR